MSKLLPARALVAASLLVLASGCALRPRYTEIVPKDAQEGQTVSFVLVDKATGKPIPEVSLVMGEGRERVRAKTDAQGVFSLPVRRGWRSTDPVLEVNLPAGVRAYEVRPAPASAARSQAGSGHGDHAEHDGHAHGPEGHGHGDHGHGTQPLKSDPTGLLTGCQVEPTPTGVSVECPELMAVVAEGEAGQAAATLADEMVEDFTADFSESFNSQIEREELQLEVAGTQRRALKVGGQLPDGQRVNGTVIAVEPASAEQKPRAVLCLFVGDETRPCGPLLSSLAEKSPEPGVYGP